jgi:hypothetical protein
MFKIISSLLCNFNSVTYTKVFYYDICKMYIMYLDQIHTISTTYS